MNKQVKADFVLLCITLVWGSTFVLMKNALTDIPTLTFLMLRFTVAFATLIVLLNIRLLKVNKRVLLYSFIVGSLLCCGLLLQVAGLNYTSASKSAFITGLSVILVPIFSAIILKKKPEIQAVIGVALAFTGMSLLSSGPASSFNIGDFLTLLAAFCFAFQIIYIDKFTREENSVLLGVYQIGFAAMFSIAFYLLFMNLGPALFPNVKLFHLPPVEYSGSVILAIAVTAVPATALALVGQTVVQKNTTPTHTALIFSMEPVFGALFAYLIPNEHGIREVLSIQGMIGCGLILLGMLLAELRFGRFYLRIRKYLNISP